MSPDIPSETYPDTKLLIANEWRDACDGKALDIINPANGLRIGTVAHAGIKDLDLALSAAHRGFLIWRKTPAHERSVVMRAAAGLLRERAEQIALLMTLEQGKPIAEARGEVQAGAALIEWFADEGMRAYGRVIPPRDRRALQLALKEPVGPVAAFTPWNFPINQVIRKLGPALAAGCSILCKAAEETPASPAALFQTFVDAGIPPGVVGLVYGNPGEISKHLIASPVIQMVTFTGSTSIGKQLASLAGAHMKRVTMELGGHAPVIIAEDADLDLAVKVGAAAKFRNAGQVCISPTRFLVHKNLADEFADRFVDFAESLTTGDGLNPSTTLGPLANVRRIAAMDGLVQDALLHGAKTLTGGARIGSIGNFFAPTVLADVSLQSRFFNEEPFGPIAGIRTVDSLEEAINEANRLPYGLSAYAFTRSFKNVQLLMEHVQVGMLWVNQPATPSAELPFGGIRDSGYGSEGGIEAVESYLNTKAVSIVGV